jgi:hypothetical protein
VIASIDLRKTRRRSSDHVALRGYLQQLVGQPFLFVRFSYGDEIVLHFGQARPYPSPKLRHLTKGSYLIAARASSWFLTTQARPTVVVGSAEPVSLESKQLKLLTPEQLEKSKLLTAGARILVADAIQLRSGRRPAYGFGFSAVLEDGSSFLIRPPLGPAAGSKTGGRSREVADWEVFTPHERYLRVGPGVQWSYLASRSAGK